MKVQEIERAVLTLPEAAYSRFRQWFLEEDWKKWDVQLETDVKAGKLDFLAEEARDAKKHGRLRTL
ncbi:MAG: hypothetical protein NTV22_15660 [bacterium]|nr:hypothetical protein [bacterium]